MITCYLDSQDYSTLTDPKTLTADHIRIRDALLKFTYAGKVKFLFSAAVVCEVVAVSPEATRLAELKAEFLSDLCKTNAFISFDRLLDAEARALAERCDLPRDMCDPQGKWFPEIPLLEGNESPWKGMRELAEDEFDSMGFSRQQRRTAARKLIKNGKPRGALKAHIEKQNPVALSAEILKHYPMKPEYAETMARYSLGRADQKEFDEALQESLCDPRWMMKWFSTNYSLSSPIADVVRQPGRELGEALRKLVHASVQRATALAESGQDSDPTSKFGEILRWWLEMQDRQLVEFLKRSGDARHLNLGSITAVEVDKYCPGISATVRSFYSSGWENIGGSRKEEPSNSQPVDALHAMYAPYVRVFRADRFMTPHIQKHVQRHGTIVVPRLSQLVNVLESEIRKFGLSSR